MKMGFVSSPRQLGRAGQGRIEAVPCFTFAVVVGRSCARCDRARWSKAKHGSAAASLIGVLRARLSLDKHRDQE